MIITQIRNATVKIAYGGVTFLIDPLLGPKGTRPPYLFSVRQDCRNPLFELPFSAQDVLDGVDAHEPVGFAPRFGSEIEVVTDEFPR